MKVEGRELNQVLEQGFFINIKLAIVAVLQQAKEHTDADKEPSPEFGREPFAGGSRFWSRRQRPILLIDPDCMEITPSRCSSGRGGKSTLSGPVSPGILQR